MTRRDKLDLWLSHHLPDDREGVLCCGVPTQRPLRFCARCSGQLAGALLSLPLMTVPNASTPQTLGLTFLVFLGAAEWFTKCCLGHDSHRYVRFLAGSAIGCGCSGLLLLALVKSSLRAQLGLFVILAGATAAFVFLWKSGRADALVRRIEEQASVLNS